MSFFITTTSKGYSAKKRPRLMEWYKMSSITSYSGTERTSIIPPISITAWIGAFLIGGDRTDSCGNQFYFLFVKKMARYLLTSKGNWRNFMAYENGVFKSEVLLLGGERFYLAKLEWMELIPKWNPLKKSEFILAE